MLPLLGSVTDDQRHQVEMVAIHADDVLAIASATTADEFWNIVERGPHPALRIKPEGVAFDRDAFGALTKLAPWRSLGVADEIDAAIAELERAAPVRVPKRGASALASNVFRMARLIELEAPSDVIDSVAKDVLRALADMGSFASGWRPERPRRDRDRPEPGLPYIDEALRWMACPAFGCREGITEVNTEWYDNDAEEYVDLNEGEDDCGISELEPPAHPPPSKRYSMRPFPDALQERIPADEMYEFTYFMQRWSRVDIEPRETHLSWYDRWLDVFANWCLAIGPHPVTLLRPGRWFGALDLNQWARLGNERWARRAEHWLAVHHEREALAHLDMEGVVIGRWATDW